MLFRVDFLSQGGTVDCLFCALYSTSNCRDSNASKTTLLFCSCEGHLKRSLCLSLAFLPRRINEYEGNLRWTSPFPLPLILIISFKELLANMGEIEGYY